MNLKISLDTLTMETAVLGGAVLGSGGGGKLEDGLYLGELATTRGGAQLVDAKSIPGQANLAVVGAVHSSGSDTRQISARQAHQAIEMLQSELKTNIAGLVNGGMGAVDSIIGWELSDFLAVPLLNAALPATYHPVPLHNLLLYWLETAASETFAVCLAGRSKQVDGERSYLWRGSPAKLIGTLADLPAGDLDSYAAAAGPLPLSALIAHGRSGLISRTLQVGEAVVAANEEEGERQLLPLCSAPFLVDFQLSPP